MDKITEKKSEKISISVPKWEKDFLILISNANKRDINNLTDNVRALLHYGILWFQRQFPIDGLDDFLTHLKAIKIHNEIDYNDSVQNLYNKIKLKGGKQ